MHVLLDGEPTVSLNLDVTSSSPVTTSGALFPRHHSGPNLTTSGTFRLLNRSHSQAPPAPAFLSD